MPTTDTTSSKNLSQSFDSHFIDVGGVKAHYWILGAKNEDPPIILLHGVGTSVLEFEQNMNFLAKEVKCVLALDLLGHGWTEKPQDPAMYTIDRQAQFILDFMTAHSIPKAHLLGWSHGGRLALQCALMESERVASMTLVAPAGTGPDVLLELRLATLPGIGECVAKFPNELTFRLLWRKVFYHEKSSSIVTKEFLQKKLEIAALPGTQFSFILCLRSLLNYRGFLPGPLADLETNLHRLKMPVLVVWGKDDLFLPVSQHSVLKNNLPTVHVEFFEKCGHAPHIEKVDIFHEKVGAFLKSL